VFKMAQLVSNYHSVKTYVLLDLIPRYKVVCEGNGGKNVPIVKLRPGHFTPRERAAGKHWIRGWLGHVAGRLGQ
jgi:hypothetical protein